MFDFNGENLQVGDKVIVYASYFSSKSYYVGTVVKRTPTEEHSKKPAETRDRIVKLMAGGGLPKIELFARQSIDGWDCWGNEV